MNINDALFGSAPNYGAIGAKNEKKRQHIIDLGLNQINAVYGGGTAPFYTQANADGAKFNKNNTYTSLTGKKGFGTYWAPGGKQPNEKFTPNSTASTAGFAAGILAGGPFLEQVGQWGLGNLFGKTESPRDIAKKAFRRGQLFNAPSQETFKGYQPEFYDAREKAYKDFALPQLADQYQNARDNTTFGLSNVGLSNSTVGDRARYRLEKAMNTGRQGIADEGISQSNQLKNQVEQSRQGAISQLYQTGDPTRALQSAVSSASQFEQPGAFGTLANGFGDVLNQYYVQQLLNGYKNPPQGGGGYGPQQNTNYFASI